jgi:hypothetical protein
VKKKLDKTSPQEVTTSQGPQLKTRTPKPRLTTYWNDPRVRNFQQVKQQFDHFAKEIVEMELDVTKACNDGTTANHKVDMLTAQFARFKTIMLKFQELIFSSLTVHQILDHTEEPILEKDGTPKLDPKGQPLVQDLYCLKLPKGFEVTLKEVTPVPKAECARCQGTEGDDFCVDCMRHYDYLNLKPADCEAREKDNCKVSGKTCNSTDCPQLDPLEEEPKDANRPVSDHA